MARDPHCLLFAGAVVSNFFINKYLVIYIFLIYFSAGGGGGPINGWSSINSCTCLKQKQASNVFSKPPTYIKKYAPLTQKEAHLSIEDDQIL